MTYKILSVEHAGGTIITQVEYNFDGTIITTAISHFQPQTVSDITLAIRNRAASEKNTLDAIIVCESLITDIVVGETIA